MQTTQDITNDRIAWDWFSCDTTSIPVDWSTVMLAQVEGKGPSCACGNGKCCASTVYAETNARDVSKMMARLRAVPAQTWLVAAICLDERNPKTEMRVLVFTSVLQSIKMRSEVYPMISIATGMMKIDDEEVV